MLTSLKANRFRCFESLRLALSPGVTIFVGDNAQGKTNFLESVYYPVLFRSFRGAPDQEVAAFGASAFHVEATVDEAGVRTLSTGYHPATRRKRIGHATRALRKLSVGRAMNIALDAARDDFLLTVMAFSVG